MTVSVLERVSFVFPAFKEQMLVGTPSHPPMVLGKDMPHFISLLQVYIAICSTTYPVLIEFFALVPPEYELEDDYIEAQAGESPILHFSVTSDPPLTENTRHVVAAEKGGIVRRFKVQDNCIIFRKVRTTDTGSYTISCSNPKGLEGKATIELDISEPASESECFLICQPFYSTNITI